MTTTTDQPPPPPSTPGPRPRRLVLRPGTHLLRRSASELQVGLDPARAVVLPDTADVRALLRTLATAAAATPAHAYDDQTLEALADSGLLMDADVLLPLVPAPPAEADTPVGTMPAAGDNRAAALPVARPAVAALAADVGDEAAALLDRRARTHVDVATCGSPEAAPVAARVAALLSDAGVHSRLLPHGVSPSDDQSATSAHPAAVGLLVAVGEPARERADGWMRLGTPHLLLRLTEGRAVLGPFVRPGETACLRCVDAHHTDVDPAWPLLVAQYATAVARPRDDTVPEPVDPLLATLAGAWAARELVSLAEGRLPVTTSATVRLDPLVTALETQRWPRHPACGCTWG